MIDSDGENLRRLTVPESAVASYESYRSIEVNEFTIDSDVTIRPNP